MIKNDYLWRNGDLVRAVPIQRADLNQAISRGDFRPEHTPKPGKGRWYNWRDVLAIAVAQDLRRIGLGPAMAFGLVQEHLSQFLRTHVDQPSDCAGVVWVIYQSDDHLIIKNPCEFVRHAENGDHLMASSESARIVVNVGRIANRVLDDLQALEQAQAQALMEALILAENEAMHQAGSSM